MAIRSSAWQRLMPLKSSGAESMTPMRDVLLTPCSGSGTYLQSLAAQHRPKEQPIRLEGSAHLRQYTLGGQAIENTRFNGLKQSA